MKNCFLLFLLLLSNLNMFSQINFQEHLIVGDSNWINHPQSVISADIDGDGDMDVISASSDNSNIKLGWFENINGYNNVSIKGLTILIVFTLVTVLSKCFNLILNTRCLSSTVWLVLEPSIRAPTTKLGAFSEDILL